MKINSFQEKRAYPSLCKCNCSVLNGKIQRLALIVEAINHTTYADCTDISTSLRIEGISQRKAYFEMLSQAINDLQTATTKGED